MIRKTLILSLVFIIFSMLTQEVVVAQVYTRIFDFKKGDQFQTETVITSNAIIKRGKQVLNVGSTENVRKKYSVKEVNNQGYKLSIEIDKMNSDIDANKDKIAFNSADKKDNSSNISNGLAFILNKPIAVTIDKHGVIQDFEEYKLEMASDTLIWFAGLQSEIFEKSKLISFLADFTYREGLKKGYTWSDSTLVKDHKSKTQFVIDRVDDNVTILNFFKTETSKLINTNSNGTYIIDNHTGLIMEKYVYVISLGYTISASKIMYVASRTAGIVEKTKKIQ